MMRATIDGGRLYCGRTGCGAFLAPMSPLPDGGPMLGGRWVQNDASEWERVGHGSGRFPIGRKGDDPQRLRCPRCGTVQEWPT